MDCDSFVLSITNQNVDIDLNILENLFDFSNLDLYHELFSNENKKVVGEFEIETPKNIRIDKFFYLRSKAYFFMRNRKNTNKLKSFSKSDSKKIKFEEDKKN